jgi:enamine deaminase RidA (YjgF/YER057c/UK114 family)
MGHQGSIFRPVPGASLSDIVSVRQWLTSEEAVRAYVEVRSKFIAHKPAALLGVTPGLVRPDFLIEIEVVAAVPAGKVKGTSNQPGPETPSAR